MSGSDITQEQLDTLKRLQKQCKFTTQQMLDIWEYHPKKTYSNAALIMRLLNIHLLFERLHISYAKRCGMIEAVSNQFELWKLNSKQAHKLQAELTELLALDIKQKKAQESKRYKVVRLVFEVVHEYDDPKQAIDAAYRYTPETVSILLDGNELQRLFIGGQMMEVSSVLSR